MAQRQADSSTHILNLVSPVESIFSDNTAPVFTTTTESQDTVYCFRQEIQILIFADWSNTAIVDVPVPINYTFSRNSQIISTKKSTEAKTTNGTAKTTLDDNTATVSYSLWIGSNISETHTINITTETNNTFYNVMQLAAQEDDHFS